MIGTRILLERKHWQKEDKQLTSFDDFLFRETRKSDKDQLKTLESLLAQYPPPKGPSIDEIFSAEPVITALVTSLADPGFDKVSQAPQVSLIRCKKLHDDPQKTRQIIQDCNKPIIIDLDSQEPRTLLKMRLLGLYGGLISLSENDIASGQFCIEYGRSYEFEIFVRCESESSAWQLQHLDCPIIWLKANLGKSTYEKIPSTRRIIQELCDLDEISATEGLHHQIGFELNHKITNF